jgi:hypothetical protein
MQLCLFEHDSCLVGMILLENGANVSVQLPLVQLFGAFDRSGL